MSDRKSRLERLEESGKAREKESPEQSSESPEASDSETVNERPTVLMYLPEDVIKELKQAYRQLNVEYAERTGEDLSKNKTFYPALVKKGIDNIDVSDLIDEI